MRGEIDSRAIASCAPSALVLPEKMARTQQGSGASFALSFKEGASAAVVFPRNCNGITLCQCISADRIALATSSHFARSAIRPRGQKTRIGQRIGGSTVFSEQARAAVLARWAKRKKPAP